MYIVAYSFINHGITQTLHVTFLVNQLTETTVLYLLSDHEKTSEMNELETDKIILQISAHNFEKQKT